MSNIVKLVDVTPEARRWTIRDALASAESELDAWPEGSEPTRGLVLVLDTRDDGYEIETYVAGLRTSEVVALLAAATQQALHSLTPPPCTCE